MGVFLGWGDSSHLVGILVGANFSSLYILNLNLIFLTTCRIYMISFRKVIFKKIFMERIFHVLKK